MNNKVLVQRTNGSPLPDFSQPFSQKSMPKSYRLTAAKPFLRWAGGKQKLIGSLLEKLPHPTTFDRYFEPFLGAGSLFLACGFKDAVLNDLNAPLINAYKQIRDRPHIVHHLLLGHREAFEKAEKDGICCPEYPVRNRIAQGGECYYYQLRTAFNEALPDDSPEQAARFIFLNHTNFNGIYRVNQKGFYNTPFGKKKNPHVPELEDLHRVSCYLKSASLRVGYCNDLLNEIDRRDFVYLDPPYPILSDTANFTDYTIDKFDEQNHRELAAFAHEIDARGAKVMISISGTPLVEELYQARRPWRYHETEIKRTISSKNPPLVVRELILTNYEPYGILGVE